MINEHTVKFFENLLRASSDGIVITDAAHNIIVVNEAFCNFFDRKYCEVIETNLFLWLEHISPHSPKLWAEMERYIYLEDTYHDIEFTLTTRNGVKHLSVKASLVGKVDIEDAGVILSIWREITEQKKMKKN